MEIKCGACYPYNQSKADFWGSDSFIGHVAQCGRANIKLLCDGETWVCRSCFNRHGQWRTFRTDQALGQHLCASHGMQIAPVQQEATSDQLEARWLTATCSADIWGVWYSPRELASKRFIELNTQLREITGFKCFVLWATPFIQSVHPDFIFDDPAALSLQRATMELDSNLVLLVFDFAWNAPALRAELHQLQQNHDWLLRE